MTRKRGLDVRLLIIDPQEDFCNPQLSEKMAKDPSYVPDILEPGTLYVPGADQDMIRLSKMIDRLGNKISRIHTTLDQHHPLAIFHGMFWIDKDGNNPPPFTIISVDDVANGVWTPKHPGMLQWATDYVKTLETGGRYPLCIWPVHCRIGSPGANVVPVLLKSLLNWENEYYKLADFISKGSNYRTEHYSAVKAEVEDPADPMTQLNTKYLIEPLEEADMIPLGGEALSHCLANTVRDIATFFNDEEKIKKFVLLTDACSNVPGFDNMGDDFIKEMTALGMQLSTTEEFLA